DRDRDRPPVRDRGSGPGAREPRADLSAETNPPLARASVGADRACLEKKEGQDMPLSGTTPSSQRTASADERILLSTPDVGPVEEEFLLRACRGGWIAPTGPDLRAFEDELAAEVGVRHAVGLSSGTAALHMGLLGLGVRPGDAVVTST